MSERKQIKISEILNLLENGYDKKHIRETYELSVAEVKLLFEHPKLKGKRPKKISIDIIDDTEVIIPSGSIRREDARQLTIEEVISQKEMEIESMGNSHEYSKIEDYHDELYGDGEDDEAVAIEEDDEEIPIPPNRVGHVTFTATANNPDMVEDFFKFVSDPEGYQEEQNRIAMQKEKINQEHLEESNFSDEMTIEQGTNLINKKKKNE